MVKSHSSRAKYLPARTLVAQLIRKSLSGSLAATALTLGGAAAAHAGTAADAAGDDTLDEVVVTSKIFRENDAFGATKMGLALKDTPQSVTVITADLIEASGMKTFGDFYKVDADGGTAHALDSFPRNYYRGFLQQGENAIRVDGFRMPGNIDLDFATFDRFEVIKGPTSTLYGQSPIGGTLNAISKLPQDQFGAELSIDAGQFSDYRVDADLTGPIGSSEQWSYRLIGAYEDSDSFLDFSKTKLGLFAPSLQFQPSDSTRFIVRYTHQEKDIGLHFAPSLQLGGDGSGSMLERLLTEGLKVPDVPRSRFYGMPWNEAHVKADFAQFQGEHTFANEWQLRAHAQYNRVNYAADAFEVKGPFDQDGFSYYTYGYSHDDTADLYGGEVDLFGKVEMFGREHTLFFGVDYNHISSKYRWGGEEFTEGFDGSLFNFYHPDYAAVPHLRLPDYPSIYDTDDEEQLYGATVQLILRPTDRLSVLLGGRQSQSTLVDRSRIGTLGAEDNVNDQPYETNIDLRFEKFTVQTGVTYKVTDAVNLYASYGQTYEPKTDREFVATGQSGKVIDPEEGVNYEIGAKADLTRDLSLTTAVFQMERTNISQADPDHPNFSLPLGTQRSRGVELGMQGRLTRQLSLYGSIAYLDAEFSDGEFEGLQPANAPKFGVSLFGSYELLDGSLKGLGFGLGAVHKSGRTTFDANWTRIEGVPVTFDFGSFTEVDARVFFSRSHWTTSLAVTNLFDEEYYSPTFERLRGATHVNPPRMTMLNVRYKF